MVSDYQQNRVCLVGRDSLVLSSCFATKGQPTGVAYTVLNGGRFFVGNKSVRSVDIYDGQGSFLGHVEGGLGAFGKVSDLVVDESNERLLVVDTAAAVVKVYDLDGNDLDLQFGAGALQQPTALTLDPGSGSVYVSDFGSSTDIEDAAVVIFSSSYAFVGSIAGKGGGMLGTLNFSSPQGLSVGADGYLYLVDSGFGQVLIFNPSGQLVKTVGERGVDEGQLFYPLDLLVDEASKDIYVCDNRNARITLLAGGAVLP